MVFLNRESYVVTQTLFNT